MSAGVKVPVPCPGCDRVADKVKEKAGDAASSAAGDALEKAANEVKESVGEAVASVGTMWMRVKSPSLTGSDADSAPSVQAGDTAGPAAESGILSFLQYASYISLAVCILALIIVGAQMAIQTRRQDAEFHVTRVMSVLIAAILISGAAAITTAVMPDRSRGESTVAFLENSLWYYTAAAVVLSVIIGGLRMAWEQRAEPGKDLVKSLLTFIVVSGAGLTVISTLLVAGDRYSMWVLDQSLDCSVESNTKCFGENMVALLGMGATSGIGVIAIIILGIMAFVGSLVQLGMMIARSGMLIVLAGALPLAASATNTAMGKQMLQKFTGWIVALLLYKPAAAIIYAAAFQLAGSDVLGGGLDALGQVVIGLFMMFLALVTLPALMKLVVSAVGPLTAGNAAGSMALAAGAGVATGAVSAGSLMGGGASAGASGVGSAAGPSGSGSDSGPSGSDGSSGSGAPGPGGADSPSGSDGASGSGTEGASGSGPSGEDGSGVDGASGAGAGEGAGAAEGAGEGAGAAAGAGEGAGAAAGGGAAAGAAGGPVGMAAGAAASGASDAASGVANAASSAAQGASDMGEDAIGEGDEPSGSN